MASVHWPLFISCTGSYSGAFAYKWQVLLLEEFWRVHFSRKTYLTADEKHLAQ